MHKRATFTYLYMYLRKVNYLLHAYMYVAAQQQKSQETSSTCTNLLVHKALANLSPNMIHDKIHHHHPTRYSTRTRSKEFGARDTNHITAAGMDIRINGDKEITRRRRHNVGQNISSARTVRSIT